MHRPGTLLLLLLTIGFGAATDGYAGPPKGEGGEVAKAHSLRKMTRRDAFLRMANHAYRRGRHARALEYLEQAVALDPDPSPALHLDIVDLAVRRKACPTVLLHGQAYLAHPASTSPGDRRNVRAALRTCRRKLAAREARLEICVRVAEPDADPPRLFVNDVRVYEACKTPLGLAPGSYRIVAEASHHDRRRHEMDLRAGTFSHLEIHLREHPGTGTLVVESTPSGATVLVDGKEVGVTPLASLVVAKGKRRIELRLEGFQPFLRNARVDRDAEVTMQAELQPAGSDGKVLSGSGQRRLPGWVRSNLNRVESTRARSREGSSLSR